MMMSFDHQHTLKSLCLWVAVALALAGCGSSPASRKTTETRNVQQIVEELKESHPGGMLVEIAQRKMEENGFECEMITDGDFVHNVRQGDGSTERKTYEHIDYIECSRRTQDGWVTFIDHVALVVEEDRVVDILANWAAVGP